MKIGFAFENGIWDWDWDWGVGVSRETILKWGLLRICYRLLRGWGKINHPLHFVCNG